MTPARTPFIKLTTIPPHATEAEARAIIWAAYYETQAELAALTPETNEELRQSLEDAE